MNDEVHVVAQERAIAIVTANIAMRGSDADAEELFEQALWDAGRIDLSSDVIEELAWLVGTMVILHTLLRGDVTPTEFWRQLARGFAEERAHCDREKETTPVERFGYTLAACAGGASGIDAA